MADGNPINGLIGHLFRHKAGKMTAMLVRLLGTNHFDVAEESVQDAMVKALQVWPYRGIPQNPFAWLVQVARNRALDCLRRNTARTASDEEAIRALESLSAEESALAALNAVQDDDLVMMFTTCHPLLSCDVRIALTLKAVAGFGIPEIARAFLAEEATVAQRLVRAKRLLRGRAVRFELPDVSELAVRLDNVLEVVYLLFNEGYAAHSGEKLVHKELCDEAVRLCSMLTEHPTTRLPKCHALLALMLFQAARLAERTNSSGGVLLLRDQSRSRWDQTKISLGVLHLGLSAEGDVMTTYHLEAGIAAAHALAPTYDATDWGRIIDLYDQLLELNPSPVAAVNRAIAIGEYRGPRAALRALKLIERNKGLARYFLLWAALGETWRQLGNEQRAAHYFRRALALPCSDPERRFLHERLTALAA